MPFSIKQCKSIFDKAKSTYAREGQLLKDHLTSTLMIGTAKNVIQDKQFKEALRFALLFHDIGKATKGFQDYLFNKGKHVNHSPLSALITAYLLCKKDCENDYIPLAFNAVRSHHSHLHTLGNTDDFYGDLKKEFNGLKEIVGDDADHVIDVLGDIFWDFPYIFKKKDKMDSYLKQVYLYSLLLYADRASASGLEDRVELPKVSILDYINSEFKDSKDTDVNRKRRELLQKVKDLDGRIIAVNASTGLGKTLSSLTLAFNLAHKYNHDRIIYALPFLSIADQVESTLRKVFKHFNLDFDRYVTVHHHLAPVRYKSGDSIDFDGLKAELMIESWSKPIILTTFVQFFNSIFKNNAVDTRKFHSIANSVVILDEVQSLPVGYWHIIGSAVNRLAESYNTRFILMSATLPRFLEKYDEVVEVRYPKNRYKIVVDKETTTPEDLAESVYQTARENPDKDIMVVLNTIKTAKLVFNKLKSKAELQNTDYVYLSTHVVPADRIRRIEHIKKSRDERNRVVVVSTQLVEAGVDIDVDIVFRDMAPIDSIVQTAGRCNRNGERELGTVYICTMLRDNRLDEEKIYGRVERIATRQFLGKMESEIFEAELFEKMNEYYNDITRKKNTEKLKSFIEKMEFDEIGTNFDLIKDKKESVFVLIDESREIFEKLKAVYQIQNKMDRKNEYLKIKNEVQKYIVNLWENDIGKLSFKGKIGELKVLDENSYDKNLGVVTNVSSII